MPILDITTTTTTTTICDIISESPVEAVISVPCNCPDDDGDFLNCYNDLAAYFSVSDLTILLNSGVFELGTIDDKVLLCQLKDYIILYNPGITPNEVFQYIKAIIDVGFVYTNYSPEDCFSQIKSIAGYIEFINPACTTTSTTTTTSSTTSTTSTTSTSTTTTSTSTTTTTTCGPCISWDVDIDQADLDDAIGNTLYPDNVVFIDFIDCSVPLDPGFYLIGYDTAGTYINGACSCSVPNIYYYKNDIQQLSISAVTNSGINCDDVITTTTTTLSPCVCYLLTNTRIISYGSYSYLNCDDVTVSGILSPGSSLVVCARSIISLFKINAEEIVLGDYENPEYNLCTCYPTTTTSTTSTTTCSCFVTAVIAVNTDCGECEEILPASIKYTNCNGVEIVEQVPAGILTELSQCAILGTVVAVDGTEIKAIQEIEPCC